ncbi:methylated-DNA--[protein]-cysteine S-methyltransferase [Flavisolibacter ginsenosidimutans]|uniref:Methylated-DNA--protein-cysteine methyltransferase n=1 Tax=Flavisolibacter ginsenosidimutans TaxID=661481 RepID=A0A5B8UET7_9BACT|nr:methylated-DNA--[protein]-cysteine S-methyltransferase [Flavisolibacter ginsenosidimutans]QEC54942.1 methylated-DNA--[protein]-cysteine S-methyltransferase [Flavisolibacter ginsenosidimutans]
MKTFTAYYPSPLGGLKLICSDEHLQALLFVNEETTLQSDEHPLLDLCAKQLDGYFSGQRRTFDLPLLQSGTGFQQKVWQLLLQIPFGKTVSYNDLSKQYGDVKAIRAVASANGKNNLAIIVPCHRVIGSNQSLTGYAGGLWRKKWLLEHEAKHYAGVRTLF